MLHCITFLQDCAKYFVFYLCIKNMTAVCCTLAYSIQKKCLEYSLRFKHLSLFSRGASGLPFLYTGWFHLQNLCKLQYVENPGIEFRKPGFH